MANIVNNYGSTIVTIFQDVIKTYERNIEIIKEEEEYLNDTEHEAELGDPKDMYKGYLIYKDIREARIRRRTAKDENEVLQDLYDYLKSPHGQTFKNKIQDIQGKAVKLRAAQEARTYHPRRRTDLTIVGKGRGEQKPFEEMLADFKKTKIKNVGGKLRK